MTEENVTLVRRVRIYGPDGESIGTTESVRATIITDKPLGMTGRDQYDHYGEWVVVRAANEEG